MNLFSDQVLARRMLEARNSGYSYRFYLRRSAKRYIFQIVYFGLSLTILAYLQIWIAFSLLAGLVAGSFLRDFGWVHAIGRTWPFHEKVIDWNEVKRLAEEQPSW